MQLLQNNNTDLQKLNQITQINTDLNQAKIPKNLQRVSVPVAGGLWTIEDASLSRLSLFTRWSRAQRSETCWPTVKDLTQTEVVLRKKNE
jgi:hypothetical protein